jgi:DNA-binding response OmpR family regulator
LLSDVKFDAILLNLSLPDSQGLDTIAQTKAKAQNIPIIVLTALNDRNQEIAALRQGAQDYLVKGKFDGELLAKSIRYSIERQNNQETLRCGEC